jgi:hypothetical protein
VLRELDAHSPTHREYTGGWWELACTGCDFATGRRLSHLDWAPHHAHRTEVFHGALIAAGYRMQRTITTAEELVMIEPGTVIQGPDFHEETFKCTAAGTFHAIASPTEYRPSELVGRGPFTILYEPEPTK